MTWRSDDWRNENRSSQTVWVRTKDAGDSRADHEKDSDRYTTTCGSDFGHEEERTNRVEYCTGGLLLIFYFSLTYEQGRRLGVFYHLGARGVWHLWEFPKLCRIFSILCRKRSFSPPPLSSGCPGGYSNFPPSTPNPSYPTAYEAFLIRSYWVETEVLASRWNIDLI